MFEVNMQKQASDLSQAEFERLEQEIRSEFPNDAMMFELHLARALEAYRSGMITKEQLLAQGRESSEEIEPL
jgi:hypothetical protein